MKQKTKKRVLQKIKEANDRTTWFCIGCALLIVLHGITKRFLIDEMTIALLVLCALPVLQQFLGSVKVSGVELALREKDEERLKQIFKFLDNVASKERWTFYQPRNGEVNLGQGFTVLIEELLKDEEELHEQLKKWLLKKDDNLNWFASEIIGYYKLEDMEPDVKALSGDINWGTRQKPGKLNCFWAYSRFHDYEPLVIKMHEKIDAFNKQWLITACLQMEREEHNKDIKQELGDALDRCEQAELEKARREWDKSAMV